MVQNMNVWRFSKGFTMARNSRISIVLLRQGATGSPTAASKRKNFRRDWTGPRLS